MCPWFVFYLSPPLLFQRIIAPGLQWLSVSVCVCFFGKCFCLLLAPSSNTAAAGSTLKIEHICCLSVCTLHGTGWFAILFFVALDLHAPLRHGLKPELVYAPGSASPPPPSPPALIQGRSIDWAGQDSRLSIVSLARTTASFFFFFSYTTNIPPLSSLLLSLARLVRRPK